MSYRRAWLLVEEVNLGLREPAVTTKAGGRRGGGAAVTTAGEYLVQLYHAIEVRADREFRQLGTLFRRERTRA
jgi:molybdate transport system regulatory protein